MAIIGYIAFGVLITLALLLALALTIQKRAGGTGSWTPEHIAYVLLGIIAKAEGKSLGASGSVKGQLADRKWLLDTFAECIVAIKEPDRRLNNNGH